MKNAKDMFLMVAVFIAAGVALPKLTIRDLVPATAAQRSCARSAVTQLHDNPLERFGLILGKSRIAAVIDSGLEIESFLPFYVPIGVLRGQARMRLMVTHCGPQGVPDSMTATEDSLRP